MTLHIIPLLILSSLLLASCGQDTIQPRVSTLPPKKVVSQNVTPAVLENSGVIQANLVITGAISTGGVKYEIINGIEVPPEPDPEINNATLAGVDVNGNGVRDDVERQIAIKSGDLSEYNNAIKIAQAYQKYLVGGIQTNDESNELLLTIACSAELIKPPLESIDIQKLIIKNKMRINAYRKVISNFGGTIINLNPDGTISGCK